MSYLVTVTYSGGTGRICDHDTLDDVHAWLTNLFRVAKVSGSVINRIKIVRIQPLMTSEPTPIYTENRPALPRRLASRINQRYRMTGPLVNPT